MGTISPFDMLICNELITVAGGEHRVPAYCAAEMKPESIYGQRLSFIATILSTNTTSFGISNVSRIFPGPLFVLQIAVQGHRHVLGTYSTAKAALGLMRVQCKTRSSARAMPSNQA